MALFLRRESCLHTLQVSTTKVMVLSHVIAVKAPACANTVKEADVTNMDAMDAVESAMVQVGAPAVTEKEVTDTNVV